LQISRFLPTLRKEHKPGSANQVADALSRAPVQDSKDTSAEVLRVLQTQVDNPVMSQVQAEQRQDPELLRILEYLEKQVLPEDPQEVRKVLTLASKGYFVIHGVLYHESLDFPGRKG